MIRQQLATALEAVGKRTPGEWFWDGDEPEWLQSTAGRMVLRPDWDNTQTPNPMDPPYNSRDAAAIVAAVNGFEGLAEMLREAMDALVNVSEYDGECPYCDVFADEHSPQCPVSKAVRLLDQWEGTADGR